MSKLEQCNLFVLLTLVVSNLLTESAAVSEQSSPSLTTLAVQRFKSVYKEEIKYLLHITVGIGAFISTVPSQQKGPGSDSRPGGPCCVEFACSPQVRVGELWVFLFPPTVQRHESEVRLIGNSELLIGVNVSVCMAL